MKGHSFFFGSRKIDYILEFANRKSLGITVNPELRVLVKAPEGATLERIEKVLLKKAPWIIKQQSFFLSFQPQMPPRRYVSGETHLYLGRQYQLKLEPAPKNGVEFKGRTLIVHHKPKVSSEKVVKQWYRQRAKMLFGELAGPLIQRFEKYGVAPSGVYIQSMPTRWGSCTPGGRIILNPELLKAPKGCIEYVIVHELCHLVHRNHTAKFFELQQKEMPQWELWKRKLDRLPI